MSEERILTVAQRRNMRREGAAAKTISIRSISKASIEEGLRKFPKREHPRPMAGGPKLRGDCREVARPCPYVSCRYNLNLDTAENGSIKINRPDVEPHQQKESCALDIAARGPQSLDDVAAAMNITREAVRLIEAQAIAKLSGYLESFEKEYVNRTKYRLTVLKPGAAE